MVNFLVICYLIIPWVFNPTPGVYEQMRLPKACFLDFIFMGMICISLMRGLNSQYRNKYLGWLSIWVFITIIFNWYNPIFLYKGEKGIIPAYNAITIEGSLHFIFALFSSFIAMSFFDREDYRKIAKYICLSAVLVTSYGIMQVLGFDPMADMVKYKEFEHNHFSALVDHPNTIGNYLAMSIPFFFIFDEIKYLFGLLIVLIGLYISQSSLSMVAFIISSIFYLFLKYRENKKFLFSIIVIFFLSLIIFFTSPAFNKISSGLTGRSWLWHESLSYIKHNPLFGQGIGIFKCFNINKSGMFWMFAHNDWLERLAEIGVVGVVLSLIVIGNSIRNFNYKKDNLIGFSYITSFAAFLIISCGSFPLEMPPVALLTLISFWGTEKL